jgi:hypothetical protein
MTFLAPLRPYVVLHLLRDWSDNQDANPRNRVAWFAFRPDLRPTCHQPIMPHSSWISLLALCTISDQSALCKVLTRHLLRYEDSELEDDDEEEDEEDEEDEAGGEEEDGEEEGKSFNSF